MVRSAQLEKIVKEELGEVERKKDGVVVRRKEEMEKIVTCLMRIPRLEEVFDQYSTKGNELSVSEVGVSSLRIFVHFSFHFFSSKNLPSTTNVHPLAKSPLVVTKCRALSLSHRSPFLLMNFKLC